MGYGKNKDTKIIQFDNADIRSQLAQSMNEVSKMNKMPLKINKGFTAHRGLQSIAPENTLKAISEAGRNGFVMVEIDSQPTLDDYWVLMHDSTVDRTTDGTGTVSSMTLTQIQALKIDTPSALISFDETFRVPLLEDALREIAYWNMGVNIDGSKFTFSQARVEYIAGLLDKYNLTEKSWIVCPTNADRQLVKQYAPNLAIGWVASPSNVDNDIVEAIQYKNALIAYSSSALTNGVLEKCNKAGIHIMAYGANDLTTAYQWLEKGVSFVETDIILPGGVY